MFNNIALDVFIGLIFVFLLYSLLASIVMEIIASLIRLRGSVLKKAINRMLDDGSGQKNMVSIFYDHPLIKYLSSKPGGKPSYINNNTFSKVTIDLLRGELKTAGASYRSEIEDSIANKETKWNYSEAHLIKERKNDKNKTETEISARPATIPDDTAAYLQSLWIDAQGDVSKFKELLEQWFGEMMDRATGWYKKYTQRWLLGVGFVIAIIFNVDTVSIATKLMRDPKLREQLVTQADAFVKAHPNLDKELKQASQELAGLLKDSANQPKDVLDSSKKTAAGLQDDTARRNELVRKASNLVKTDIKNVNEVLGLGFKTIEWKKFYTYLFGWLLTALAISLGAPFWFDMLNKIMQLRGAISSKDSKSSSIDNTSDSKTIQRVG